MDDNHESLGNNAQLDGSTSSQLLARVQDLAQPAFESSSELINSLEELALSHANGTSSSQGFPAYDVMNSARFQDPVVRSFRREDDKYSKPSEDFALFRKSFPVKKFEEALGRTGRLSSALKEILQSAEDYAKLKVDPKRTDKDEAVAQKDYMLSSMFLLTSSQDSKWGFPIRYCHPRSALLGSVYYARSGVFLNCGDKQKALEDIDRALNCDVSKETRRQFYLRKHECLYPHHEKGFLDNVQGLLGLKDASSESFTRIKKDVEGVGKYGYDKDGHPRRKHEVRASTHPDNIAIKITGKKNLLIAGASDAIKLKYLPERGRFYVATRQIQPGEIVLVEKPYAVVLFAENWSTHCQYCADVVKNGIPCSKCATVIFCSESCRKKAKRYHSVECEHMMSLAQFACTGGPYLAYRMITDHPLDYFLQRREVVEKMHEASTQVMPMGTIEAREYVNVYCLTDHATEKSAEDMRESLISAIYFMKLLESAGYFGPHPNLEDKVFITTLLMRNIMIFDCSYFTYHERELSRNNLLTEPPDRGMAIFSAASLANHSCAPNLSHYFVSSHLVLRAMDVIAEGQECSISYGEFFYNSPIHKRRQYLDGYFFSCDCVACENDWPMLASLPPSLKCPHCQFPANLDNVQDMAKYSCPRCDMPWKPFVDQFSVVKKEAREADARISAGNVDNIKDDIWSIEEYLKALYVVSAPPNPEYYEVSNDLSYLHIIESLVTQRSAVQGNISLFDRQTKRHTSPQKMGVPAFFRWLSRKYPSVIISCVEDPSYVDEHGNQVPVDTTKPNPNNVEFDNLYLDMNGIIHPCTHPEDKPAPQSEDEMMTAIFDCIDRLMRIVRPRKLLYMAIDGVAPRAKMNQQRSRRFRASKESFDKQEEMAKIKEELRAKGAYIPEKKDESFHFDSNCITPGTPFMDRLSKCLHFYIHDRLNNDPGWQNICVILSDANVPGEGEHKIMDYVRKQRANPNHDPNTHHVLCGADADLIMLGLATHEPNFTIIREEFKPNKPRPCDICGQMGHEMSECQGAPRNPEKNDTEFGDTQRYIFVRLSVLREYLAKDLVMTGLTFEYDFERVIDDWVFMCFFVGNDFLPHLPSLEIRENAIDRLVTLYKNTVRKTNGYVTKSGVVQMDKVQIILSELGELEDEIFRNRQNRELEFRRRNKRNQQNQHRAPNFIPGGQFAPNALGGGKLPNPLANVQSEGIAMRQQSMGMSSMTGQSGSDQRDLKRVASAPLMHGNDEDDEPPDEVRLWEAGFKDRYYESKFDCPSTSVDFRYKVAQEYAYGLCWVLRYYYQGVPSWKWYFPYHYAPFASDFMELTKISNEFEKNTKPFKPLEQLMGVFPAASRAHVPAPWGELMLKPSSPIIDFYPIDFKIDLNGKKFAWQGVALLPFVDEKRLKSALEPYYDLLTDEEIRRNIRGKDRLYVPKKHPGFDFINELQGTEAFGHGTKVPINPDSFHGIAGIIMPSNDYVEIGGVLESPVEGMKRVKNAAVVSTNYQDPVYPKDHLFSASRLPGAKDPPNALKPEDFRGNYRPMIGFARMDQQASLGVPVPSEVVVEVMAMGEVEIGIGMEEVETGIGVGEVGTGIGVEAAETTGEAIPVLIRETATTPEGDIIKGTRGTRIKGRKVVTIHPSKGVIIREVDTMPEATTIRAPTTDLSGVLIEASIDLLLGKLPCNLMDGHVIYLFLQAEEIRVDQIHSMDKIDPLNSKAVVVVLTSGGEEMIKVIDLDHILINLIVEAEEGLTTNIDSFF
ncbi:unnamed protein product [Notodromas monacha]|uniref:5'-3' exoribonuclease 2 homolog n=1 Tax=Notodromas monacha TaxID=399045 RepID=A0A7R9BNT4_9CRUS|nr:unnamed protein product [Notodromas monacha]CAG0918930.1 unnamed protein product [Notodromas monacha]